MTVDRAPVTPESAAPAARQEHLGPVATAASIAWAGVPLVTAGFGTWAAFLFAAGRRRSARLGIAAAGYAALPGVMIVAENATPHPGALALGIGTAAWGACSFGGFAHALAIRRKVFSEGQRGGRSLRGARQEALRRRKLREEARAVAARDPGLARELRIGRPDLPRDFDDGGLVDVNSAPGAVLAALPGMTPELAQKTVKLRSERGPFVSADDLSVTLGLRPEWVASLADLTVYLA